MRICSLLLSRAARCCLEVINWAMLWKRGGKTFSGEKIMQKGGRGGDSHFPFEVRIFHREGGRHDQRNKLACYFYDVILHSCMDKHVTSACFFFHLILKITTGAGCC